MILCIMNGADIMVYDRDNRVVAVVEVKAAREKLANWAANLRHQLLRDIPDANQKFMIIIGREESYLWSGQGESAVVATTDLLGSYLRRINSQADHVTPEALELIVGIWLSDLTRSRIPLDHSGPAWLRESGLLDAVKDGRVEFQAAA
jgi:hypothetical protein